MMSASLEVCNSTAPPVYGAPTSLVTASVFLLQAYCGGIMEPFFAQHARYPNLPEELEPEDLDN